VSEEENLSNLTPEKGFFSKLAAGDFGLAKTYWIYNVFVAFVANFLINIATSTGLLLIIVLANTAYCIPAYTGLWRAATRYEGPKLWAILAKIVTIFGVILVVVGLMVLLSLL